MRRGNQFVKADLQ